MSIPFISSPNSGYGVVIIMYSEAGERHHIPHFHVRYAEHRATVAIASVNLAYPSLNSKQKHHLERVKRAKKRTFDPYEVDK
jgi:hypothetical protein